MENKKYNLESEEDMTVLSEEVNANADYFVPKENITYKLKLLDTQIEQIRKEDKDGNEYVKYGLNVEIRDKSGVVFSGVYEAPQSVMRAIMKSYVDNEGNMLYTISRSGSGMDTRYNVTEDY